MYILIHIGTNDCRVNQFLSIRKNKIESYLKDKGYYYSKKLKRYINDKNCSGTDYITDYIIKKIDLL